MPTSLSKCCPHLRSLFNSNFHPPIYIMGLFSPSIYIFTFSSSFLDLIHSMYMELQLDLALSVPDPIQDRRSSALHHHKHELTFSKRNGGMRDEFVVGWPPVKSWRKQVWRGGGSNYVNVENGSGGRGPNCMYVKVKMEGVGITRKIDLSIHRSYRTLSPKLVALFGKCKENSEYKLMYQNKEGEWVQARDVPWECFIRAAQRLKLEKSAYF